MFIFSYVQSSYLYMKIFVITKVLYSDGSEYCRVKYYEVTSSEEQSWEADSRWVSQNVPRPFCSFVTRALHMSLCWASSVHYRAQSCVNTSVCVLMETRTFKGNQNHAFCTEILMICTWDADILLMNHASECPLDHCCTGSCGDRWNIFHCGHAFHCAHGSSLRAVSCGMCDCSEQFVMQLLPEITAKSGT
jgi:hypothetical protein